LDTTKQEKLQKDDTKRAEEAPSSLSVFHPKSLDLGIHAVRSVAQDGPLGDLRADRGERDTLIPLRHRPAAAAQQGGPELFLEVAVEETIDDGVDTGGGHGREVAEREDEVVATGRDGLVVPIKHRVEDAEREPGECECHHDGE